MQATTWKYLLVGLPLVVLVLTGIAVAGVVSVELIIDGAQGGQVGRVVGGSVLAFMWILMFYKTATARRAASRT